MAKDFAKGLIIFETVFSEKNLSVNNKRMFLDIFDHKQKLLSKKIE